MGLGSPKVVHELDFRDISTVKPGGTLGSYAETPDGRGYRLALNGASELAPGKINVAETVDTDATDKTVARTYAAGATEIIIDAGGAVAADRYADGYLNINDATGEGISYGVKSNTGTSGAGELTVRLAEPLETALTIDVSEASLTANPYSGVVVSVADQLDCAVGIANVTVTAAYYHWEQTHGICAALADESYAIGQALVIGSSVVGALEAQDAAGEQVVGTALVAGVDTEYRDIFLTIN